MSCKESKLSDAVEQMLLSRNKHNEHIENTLVEGIQEVLSKERELDLLMLKGVLKDFNEKLQQATYTDCEYTHDTEKVTGVECNNKCPVSDFIDSVQISEKNGYGTQYKYGENNPHTLEHDYEEMIKLKIGGSDKWDDCLDKYEDAFYEYVFTGAIDKSLKDGHGIKHKFGMDNGTLENAYMEMLTWQSKGSKQFDYCIRAYQDAFIVDTDKDGEDKGKDVEDDAKNTVNSFIRSVKFSVENGHGPQLVFGLNKNTLEDTYKSMLKMKEDGSDQWDDCIKHYEDSFYSDMFISAIDKAVKDGNGINHKFGVNKLTLELAYNQMTAMQDHESTKWDTCIEAYKDAFIVDTDKNLEDTNTDVEDVKTDDTETDKGKETQIQPEDKPTKHKKKDGGKEEDGGQKNEDDEETDAQEHEEEIAIAKAKEEAIEKAKQEAIDKEKSEQQSIDEAIAKEESIALAKAQEEARAKAKAKAKQEAIDDEERTTINALIDKVELLWKSGKYKYAEHDVYEPPETFEYRTARQGLISFYKEMLKEQESGSDKWNPCIQKYQDTFIEHAFINLIKNGKGIDQKFGSRQNRIEDVYNGMITVQANDEDEWDDCIIAYQDKFRENAFIGAIKRSKLNGMGIKYMFIKNKFTLEQLYKQMRQSEDNGDKKFYKSLRAYEHEFGYDKNLIK